jgi:hypothetical protein
MKKVRCYINRNLTHSAPVEVPPWELEILRAVHGADKIELLGQVSVDCEVPYVDVEAERLTKRFGEVEATGVPWFVQVFGAEERGIRALADSIERSTGVKPLRKQSSRSLRTSPTKSRSARLADRGRPSDGHQNGRTWRPFFFEGLGHVVRLSVAIIAMG